MSCEPPDDEAENRADYDADGDAHREPVGPLKSAIFEATVVRGLAMVRNDPAVHAAPRATAVICRFLD